MKYKFCGNKLCSEVSFSLSCTSIQFQDKIESSLRLKHLKAANDFGRWLYYFGILPTKFFKDVDQN